MVLYVYMIFNVKGRFIIELFTGHCIHFSSHNCKMYMYEVLLYKHAYTQTSMLILAHADLMRHVNRRTHLMVAIYAPRSPVRLVINETKINKAHRVTH